MTDAGAEFHKSAQKAVTESDARIPREVRWLAYMSTSRWKPCRPVHPAVSHMAAAMEADGWMIRGAWTRNYLLWRNGRTIVEEHLPLLVLPLAFGHLSPLYINVFITVEIIKARSRLQQARGRDHDPADVGEVQSGVAIADPFRLHREAALDLGKLMH